MAEQTWRWVRSAAAKYEDAWRERLSFLKPDSLVIHGHPSRKLIRIEAYAGKPAGLRVLAEVFGGKVEKFDTDRIAARANAPRRALRIGRKLGIIDTNGRWPDNLPRPEILLRIGSAMAFGTGEHATTSSCLRFLINEAESCGPEWTCLDLGTGSGILALYAQVRGCPSIAACDIEEPAVAAARDLLPGADVRLGGAETMPVVDGMVANMTGSELRAAMPAMLARWRRTHALVLSGMRAHEVDAVVALVDAPIAHRVTVGDFTSVGYRGAAR